MSYPKLKLPPFRNGSLNFVNFLIDVMYNYCTLIATVV